MTQIKRSALYQNAGQHKHQHNHPNTSMRDPASRGMSKADQHARTFSQQDADALVQQRRMRLIDRMPISAKKKAKLERAMADKNLTREQKQNILHGIRGRDGVKIPLYGNQGLEFLEKHRVNPQDDNEGNVWQNDADNNWNLNNHGEKFNDRTSVAKSGEKATSIWDRGKKVVMAFVVPKRAEKFVHETTGHNKKGQTQQR